MQTFSSAGVGNVDTAAAAGVGRVVIAAAAAVGRVDTAGGAAVGRVDTAGGASVGRDYAADHHGDHVGSEEDIEQGPAAAQHQAALGPHPPVQLCVMCFVHEFSV
jgi:hypothetical protein